MINTLFNIYPVTLKLRLGGGILPPLWSNLLAPLAPPCGQSRDRAADLLLPLCFGQILTWFLSAEETARLCFSQVVLPGWNARGWNQVMVCAVGDGR